MIEMTEKEWNNKSLEWKRGWRAGIAGEDLDMSKEEIENMSDDWKDGLKFAIKCPFGGSKPM